MALKRIVVSLVATFLLSHAEVAQARTPIRSQGYAEDGADDIDDNEDTGYYEEEANQYSRSSQERAERRKDRDNYRNPRGHDREDIDDVMAHMSGPRKGDDILERSLGKRAGSQSISV